MWDMARKLEWAGSLMLLHLFLYESFPGLSEH